MGDSGRSGDIGDDLLEVGDDLDGGLARDNAHGQAAGLREDGYNLMLVAIISQLRGQERSPGNKH
jgi:hypothetical protein